MASKPQSNIAELRRSLKLTQLELSQKVGVTETTIANWEKNRGGGLELIERFVRLCEALQCRAQDLISYGFDPAVSSLGDTSLATIRKDLGVSEPAYFSNPDESTSISASIHTREEGQEQPLSPEQS